MSGVNTSRVDQPDQSAGAYSAFGRDTSPEGRLSGRSSGVWPGYVPEGRLSGRVSGVWPGYVPRGALERAHIGRLAGIRPSRGA